MEVLSTIRRQQTFETEKKNFETPRVGISFSVVFFFYQNHRATRRYEYVGAEKKMQIFGCTDHS